MAHAIGAIGTGMDLRTRSKQVVSPEQRERNKRLVPRRRNQTRNIAFIEIHREGEKTPKVRAIRAGQLHHYKTAFMWAKVDYLRDEKGRPVLVSRKTGKLLNKR